MPFDATNHTFSPPPQKKTLVAHTNRVANPELGEHHMLAAVVVAENVAAEAAVVPSLPQRVQEGGEAHDAAGLHALSHHVVGDPLRYASDGARACTGEHAVEGVEDAREAVGADARDAVVAEEEQPLAVVLAVAALADVAADGGGGHQQLRAEREVALALLLGHQRYA